VSGKADGIMEVLLALLFVCHDEDLVSDGDIFCRNKNEK